MPPRTKNFTGRADILEQLNRQMASDSTLDITAVLPHALQGLGGVGKSSVATEYAYRYQGDYDLICWIRADQMPLVRSALAALALPLGLDPPSATGIELATAGVLDALRRGEPFDRWLLIFDNADQPEDLLPLIPSSGDVLITSRNHRWQSVATAVSLDVFERSESIQFLSKRVPKGLTDADADLLAEKLGDLPLALEQAGAVINEGGMTAREYLRQLDERVTQILAQGTSPEYPTSMTAAWQISVAKLRQQSPAALELLRCFAFFGPEPIPREVLKLGRERSRTGVGDLLADPIELSSAISMLGRYALVKIDGPYITIHRLIQALLRDELKPAEQGEYRQDAHTVLVAGAPQDPSEVGVWPRYADLVAHVGAQSTDLAHCQMAAHRAFALDVMRYLFVSGDFVSCRSFAEQFIAQWSEDSGADDPYVLDARRYLGNALRELGFAHDAYQLVESTLRNAERVLGPLDRLTLHLRNSFGADLRAHGDFAAALDLDTQNLAIHHEVFKSSDPQILRVMNNLALDYGLNSRFTESRDLHKVVYIEQRDATRNISVPELLNSWTGLARAVRLCGNLIQARDLGQDARNYGLHELGPEHHLSLRAATDLSIAMRGIQANHEEALELATDILERCRLRRGDKNPDTMAAAVSLSNILRVVGQTAESLELATETVGNYPSVYGAEHPYHYGCMGNLALLYRLTGDTAKACQIDETALAGLDAKLTRNHFFSLIVAVNLASDLADLGDTAGARALGEDTLVRVSRLLGEDHPLTLGCAVNLSLDRRAEGDTEAADPLASQVLLRYEATIGTGHPAAEAAAAGLRLNFDFDPPPI